MRGRVRIGLHTAAILSLATVTSSINATENSWLWRETVLTGLIESVLWPFTVANNNNRAKITAYNTVLPAAYAASAALAIKKRGFKACDVTRLYLAASSVPVGIFLAQNSRSRWQNFGTFGVSPLVYRFVFWAFVAFPYAIYMKLRGKKPIKASFLRAYDFDLFKDLLFSSFLLLNSALAPTDT